MRQRIKAGLRALAGVAVMGGALAACGTTAEPGIAPDSQALTARDLPGGPAYGDGGVPAFYTSITTAPPQPGLLLAQEPLEAEKSLPSAGSAVRILYSSLDGIGGRAPVTVSGALFLPRGEAPAGGWPLVAWAHGTVGVADVCAPSFNPRSARDRTYLSHWLDQGYAVVASDYQGLGVPGGHPYLATRPQAWSVLDSIRAVQGGAFPVARPVVIVGQSQGGQSAIAAAGLAGTYAPELDLRGTVATGAPYFQAGAPLTPPPGDAVTPITPYTVLVLSLARYLEPGFDPQSVLTPTGQQLFQMSMTSCYGPMVRKVMEERISWGGVFARDPLPPIAAHSSRIAYETLALSRPLFMGTGGRDIDVPPEGQRQLARDACRAGSNVTFRFYPELDHSGAVNGSLPDSTPFVRALFARETVTGSCPLLQ